MQLDKFTIKSQEAVQRAHQMAVEREHQAIECGHLLKALWEVDEYVLPFIFKKLAINVQQLDDGLDKTMNKYPKVSGGQVYLSNSANKALIKAEQSIKEFGDEYVSLEHILLGLMQVSTYRDSLAALLQSVGHLSHLLSAGSQNRMGYCVWLPLFL